MSDDGSLTLESVLEGRSQGRLPDWIEGPGWYVSRRKRLIHASSPCRPDAAQEEQNPDDFDPSINIRGMIFVLTASHLHN